MIVVLKPNLPLTEVEKVIAEVAKLGYEPRPIHGKVQTVIAAIGDESTHQSLETLASWPQVEHVHRVQKRYKLVSREVKKAGEKDSILNIHGQKIGAGQKFCFMAGPCSVESEEQLMSTAKAVKASGATFLRGGAYKPRTSPYEFQGLAKEATQNGIDPCGTHHNAKPHQRPSFRPGEMK
jgi:3-deoxy-7-phosphoheptulonate synthase